MCQDTDWVGGNNKEALDTVLLQDGVIQNTKHEQRKMWLSWVHFWLVWGPERGHLGSQKVDLRCRDTDWVDGNDKEVLNAILLGDRFI